MTITNPTSYTKDTDPWVHGTFIVSLGADATGRTIDYDTYIQVVQNNQRDELYSRDGLTPMLDPNMAQVVSGAVGGTNPLPVYFSHRKCRDTSLGGNEAINCLYQYNETDDPPHPFTMAETQASTGMGRVYSESLDDHQQILYITFGLPVFNNLAEFYKAALDKDIADFVNTGATTTLLTKLKAMVDAAVTTLVKIPSLPSIYLQSLLGGLVNTKITKYYDFSNRMDLYYKYVQDILNQISVNMGFMNDANLLNQNPALNGTGGVVTDQTFGQQVAAANQETNDAGAPDIFRTFHMSIYQIMQRRASFMTRTGFNTTANTLTTDQAVYEQTMAVNNRNQSGDQTAYDISMLNPLQQLTSGFASTIYNALAFVGFRIEKTTDTSESLSNQIGPSEIAGFINSKAQAARESKFKAMYGRTGVGWVDSLGDWLGGIANSAVQKVDNSKGIEGLTALATGSGMVDIPEVWKDSSMSKNYSFEVKLRAPYGDPLSIIESLYVPLIMLMVGAMPRATGASSYGTPFICRAYCRGMFGIPLGMIESMTIKRGSDVNGWNYQRLPTSIDVNFTIKDLSPSMYMAMADPSEGLGDSLIPTSINWNQIFAQNSSFQEYLLTLSGMGIAERTLWTHQFRRKAQLLLQTTMDQRLNVFYWDSVLGNSTLARVITKIIPTTKLPQN